MDAFEKIYRTRYWGYADNETLSGGGSTKRVNILRTLFFTWFINNNQIKKVYDICGDCNWQHDFVKLVKTKDFEYFGFDISPTALNSAKEKNKGNCLKFSEKPIDLCRHVLKCDDGDNSMIIIKEVIQHLPLNLAINMLRNIKKSGIKYLAITNHDSNIFNVTANRNINIGSFYPNNMFLPPFNFKNPIANINNYIKNKALCREKGNLIVFNIQEQSI